MSKNAGKSEMAESNRLMRDSVARLEAIGIPTIEAQKIVLQNPELVEPLIAEQMGASQMEDVQMDPRLQAAQREALDEITGLAKTGLGAEDKAAFNQLRRQAAGAAEAEQASTLRDLGDRGMLDSGSGLIALLNAGQKASDRMSQEGDRLAASASEARRAALGQQANMASQMSAQDLGLKTAKASAADTINQFNTQQRAQTGASNIGYQRGRASDVANTANQQEAHNKGLIQQRVQNEFQRAGGIAQQQNALAGNLQQQASGAQQAQQAQTGAILNLAGTLGAGAMKSGKA
jgi:hypothetical protein